MNCVRWKRKQRRRQRVLTANETGRRSRHIVTPCLSRWLAKTSKIKMPFGFHKQHLAYLRFPGTRHLEPNYQIDAQADHQKKENMGYMHYIQ